MSTTAEHFADEVKTIALENGLIQGDEMIETPTSFYDMETHKIPRSGVFKVLDSYDENDKLSYKIKIEVDTDGDQIINLISLKRGDKTLLLPPKTNVDYVEHLLPILGDLKDYSIEALTVEDINEFVAPIIKAKILYSEGHITLDECDTFINSLQ